MRLEKIKKKYFKDGYVKLKNLFDKKEIREILSELTIVKLKVKKTNNHLFFHETKDGKINTIHNIQKFYKKSLVIEKTKKKLKSILHYLLKDKVSVRNIEFFLKPKKTGMPSPFHQDNFYWNIKQAKAANVWIALSKSYKINGGLCYLKGSHKLGTVNHITSFMKGSSQKIPDDVLKKINFPRVFPKMNVGDCLIHHPEVIHGSFHNKSNYDRIGFVISFATNNCQIYKDKIIEYKKNLEKNLKKIY